MLTRKNCAAGLRNLVTWLRIMRSVSRVSSKVVCDKQRLEHFWEVRYFDCLHRRWRSRSLRRVRNIQEYLLSIIRFATSDRAKAIRLTFNLVQPNLCLVVPRTSRI
jgi:hypothetical protein